MILMIMTMILINDNDVVMMTIIDNDNNDSINNDRMNVA